MIKILFLIRSLNVGGAERQLITLAGSLDRSVFSTRVLVFYGEGVLEKELTENGIPVIVLQKQGRWDILPFFLRLLRQVIVFQPDILHAYLSAANILACLMKPLYPAMRVVLGVRFSFVDFNQYDWLTRLVYWLEEHLVRLSDLVIVNSNAGRALQLKRGVPAEKIALIPNGIDTQRYQPQRPAGTRLRCEWGLGDEKLVVGMVGRLDPIKDHPSFLQAAARVVKEETSAHFVIFGDGPAVYRQELQLLASQLGLEEHLTWLKDTREMTAAYNAMDICVSCSIGEGFSNVIAEAMACGVPCVVTAVGDSALIIGDTGLVVPPGIPELTARAVQSMLKMTPLERNTLGMRARERMVGEFSLPAMVMKTEIALKNLVKENEFDR